MEKTQGIGKQRVEKRLDRFAGKIDMADWARKPPEQVRQAFLSRALAAYCIQAITGTTADVAAASVTDSFHDRGIDAICYDQKSARLLVVTSRWADVISWKDAGEFCDGVSKLVDQEWTAFSNNARISGRHKELKTALDADIRITLITVCIGAGLGDAQATKRVDDLAQRIDDGAGIASAMHWRQRELLDAVRSEAEPPKIDADLVFCEYGEVKEPYAAVYGRVQAQQIVDLWRSHTHLSHSNLRRYFVSRTDVNNAMADTVKMKPDHFWYFNNGLTIICDSFAPGVSGRIRRQEGIFRFRGMSLVNGAQTTGILAEHLDEIPASERDKLWIQVRVIATKDCPQGFGTQITKYTNLQNAVTAQDFVALDPIQSTLATDFAQQKRQYVFKSGESAPHPVDGCTLRDTTIALACADPDTWYAVQVKREISVLWQMGSARYRQLFHDNLTATRVWNAVSIMREVDESTKSISKGSSSPKADVVAAHLQRILLHCVFRSNELTGWDTAQDPKPFVAKAGELCRSVFRQVCEYVVSHHPTDYLASLSKNFEKSTAMINALVGGSAQPTLPFPDPPEVQPIKRRPPR